MSTQASTKRRQSRLDKKEKITNKIVKQMVNAKQEALKMRKEKRADFFYALSKYIFVGDVVGGFSPVVLDITKEVNWYAVVTGFIVTSALAFMGDQILKTKN